MAPGNPHKDRGMSVLFYLHPELPEQGLALLLVDRLNDVQGSVCKGEAVSHCFLQAV